MFTLTIVLPNVCDVDMTMKEEEVLLQYFFYNHMVWSGSAWRFSVSKRSWFKSALTHGYLSMWSRDKSI